jgi:hypothetical protein
MIPAVSFNEVKATITQRFKSGQYPEGASGFVRMTGILFAPPTSQLGEKEIVPNLNRFHLHSGKNIDFFCAGYAMGSAPKSWGTDYKTLPPVEGRTWSHSDSAFDAFRRELQGLSTWRYSGGCDLLLANAVFAPTNDSSQLHFDQAIDLKLDEMAKVGAIVSVEVFFGRIFQYAEEASGKDSTWGFSDREGLRSLKQLVLSFLPKDLNSEMAKGAFFAVRDLRKAA